MRVAGIMSGTSLDGIDVAIVEIRGRRVETIGFTSTAYPDTVRAAILGVSNCPTHTAEISRLNFQLAELYARAVRAAIKRYGAGATHRLPRTDHLSRRPLQHLADRRAGRPGGTHRSPGGFQFPRARYRGRRAGRAAGAVRGLPALPSSAAHSRGAQYRRHREYHGDPGRLHGRRRSWLSIPVRATW